jgi:Pretoxin HINT domain
VPWQSAPSRIGWKSQEGYSQLGRDIYEQACFLAGTPLLTPDGGKLIEEFKIGDEILSRPEHDPAAEVTTKRVEEVFVRTGRIMILRVQGRDIGTTPEHPFWVRHAGWTPAGELKPGMELSTHDGRWVPVDAVRDTGEYQTVYNLRVSDYHTYFVGDDDWGWTAWAHNAYNKQQPSKPVLQPGELDTYGELRQRTGEGKFDRDHIPSKGALKIRAAQLKGKDLTPEEEKMIENAALAVVIPKDLHKEGRTYAGKNTLALQTEDAADLAGAAAKDIAAHLENLPTGRADDPAGLYKPAFDQILQLTNADYDTWLKGLLGIR